MSRVFFAPGDWLGARFTARTRRAFAAWTLIVVVVTMPLRYRYRASIPLLWVLSEFAIVVALAAICAAETPVEQEGE